MTLTVSHQRSEESPEAKARWFQSLPLADRMDLLCSITDLALTANPRMADAKDQDAQQTHRRILVLSHTRR